MFDRFTADARKAMALARRAALRFGHAYIGTEHMLLGLLQVEPVADIFARLGIETAEVVRKVEGSMVAEPQLKGLWSKQLPFTSRAKKALEFSMEEAHQLRHNFIDVEHVLLGVIREHDDVAGQVLSGMGVDLEKVRPIAAAGFELGRWPSEANKRYWWKFW